MRNTFLGAIHLIKSRDYCNLLIQVTDQHPIIKQEKEYIPVKCIEVKRLVSFLI